MSGHLHITVSSGGFEANDAGPIAMVTDDADVLLDAIVASLEGIDFSNITRIRVTATDNGVVVLGVDGRPLRPIIWENDESSVPDAGWCLKKHDESWWTREAGMVPTFRSMVTPGAVRALEVGPRHRWPHHRVGRRVGVHGPVELGTWRGQ